MTFSPFFSIRFLRLYFVLHNSSIVLALGPFTVSLSGSVTIAISLIAVGHDFRADFTDPGHAAP